MLGRNNLGNNQQKIYLIKDGVTQDFSNLPLTITNRNSKPTDKSGYVLFKANGYYIQKEDLPNYRVCCRYSQRYTDNTSFSNCFVIVYEIPWGGVPAQDYITVGAGSFNGDRKISVMTAQTEDYKKVTVASLNQGETWVYDLWLEKSNDNQ